MSIVEFKNTSFCYNNSSKKAIDNLNLIVEKGEFVTILGHNGSGKSTLAKLINGLLLPTNGQVLVNGFSTQDKKSLPLIRRTAGMVFQNPDNQAVATIVEDDIAFGPENLGLSRTEIKERIDFALKVTEMEEFRKKAFSNLSGGQKQRIAIAGILAMKPELIILDESTSMLDPKGRKEVLNIAHKLNKEENITIILITHYMDEAVNADKVVVLNQGKITKIGTPTQVFYDEQTLLSAGLTFPRPMILSKQLLSRGIDCQVCIKKQDLLSSIANTLQKGNYYQEISSFSGSVNLGESVISCNDLTYTYNKKSKFAQRAISDISLDINGALFGIDIKSAEMGKSTVSTRSIIDCDGYPELEIRVRYPNEFNLETVSEKIKMVCEDKGFDLTVIPGHEPYINDKDSEVVKILAAVANEVKGTDKQPYTNGATYAHYIPNAYIFGMDGNCPPDDFEKGRGSAHGVDESVSVSRLKEAMKIYARALLALNEIKW